MEGSLSTARAPRGPYQVGIERRAQILDGAIQVFGSEGYTGTLKQVAELVGLTPAGITVHFGSKEGLLIEVLKSWGQAQLPLTEPSTFEDYLASWQQLMIYHTQHRGLLKLYLRLATEASSASHPAYAFVVERNRQTVQDLVTRLRSAVTAQEIIDLDDDEVMVEARELLAIVEGIEMQWILDERVDLVGIVSNYLSLMLNHLQRRKAPQ
jgi:AcrR family transcriptional regulator